jgi:aspartate/methionine/tyrosine aminotransferase
MDTATLLSDRARGIDASGIRRVFELGATMADPINLSIGQPDFPVPDPVKRAAIEAIDSDQNGYTLTQGIAPLRERIAKQLAADIGWDVPVHHRDDPDASTTMLVTSGTSGALQLAFMSLLNPGDEIVIPDPYFAMYPHAVSAIGGVAVRCPTYPDFRMTAERVEAVLTDKTKAVLLNAPSNPAGVVLSGEECRELLELCRSRGVLLISDEIYDEFTFADARTEPAFDEALGDRCPSPCRVPGASDDVLLIRGLGKTYGVTGWRLGYAAGPEAIVSTMQRLQQYTYVCAPAPLQHGGVACFDIDMTDLIAQYATRRDLVLERLREVTEVVTPGGAFYAFFEVPKRLGMTAAQFAEACAQRELLVIPGNVFSDRDTHVRLSFAAPPARLERGLDVLVEMMKG